MKYCDSGPVDRKRKTKSLLAVLAVVWLLASCASQQAFEEGQSLVKQGRHSEAVARFEEALKERPNSAPYRLALMNAKSASQRAILDAAEAALVAQRLDEAEQLYAQALSREPGDARALSGIRRVDASRRHDAWLKDAQEAASNHDHERAKTRVRNVLMEQPDHRGALALMRKIDDSLAEEMSPEQLLADVYKKPISIEFKDTSIKTIFEVLSRTSGLNFLLDKDVRLDQKTSIFFKNATVEAAVNLVLLTNQLEQRVLDENTVLIFPSTQGKLKDYQPLVVRSFYLANAEAKAVANTIKTLLKSRDVIVDDKLNLVIMRDSPEAVRMAEKLVAMHDVPEAEVMLEVEILEVKRSQLQDLGVRWPEVLSLTPLPATANGALTVDQLRNLNGSSIGAAVGSVSINVKNQNSAVNILANPRIRAKNKEKAKVLIGEKVPNITTTATSTGFVSDSVTYVDVGLKLDVEPTVFPDREVAMKISLEVSNIIGQIQTKSGTQAYQIGTRLAQTVLRLKDGENQVLAGLINDEDRRSSYRVPALGDVPVLGRLFGSQADEKLKTEIVLSITPRILRGLQQPHEGVMEFESGTESSLSNRVLSGLSKKRQRKTRDDKGNGTSGSTGSVGAAASSSESSEVADRTASGSTEAGRVSGADATDATSGEPTAGDAAIKLTWSAPAQVRSGEKFDLVLNVSALDDLASLPLAFSFDPSQLKVLQVSEGGFMRQGPGKAALSVNTDQKKGRVLLSIGKSDGGVKGDGELIRITMEATGGKDVETRINTLSATSTGAAGQLLPTSLPTAHVLRIKP